MNNLDYYENSTYSQEVYESIRYGFQYRKISEELATSDGRRLNFCLTDYYDILVPLANWIISGVSYDLLKAFVKNIWDKFKDRIFAKKDNDLNDIFAKEDCLYEFYTYVKEFHEKRMNITEEQENYIKEEVMADYCSEQYSIIFSKYKRFVSVEESIVIKKEGRQKADKIIIRRK